MVELTALSFTIGLLFLLSRHPVVFAYLSPERRHLSRRGSGSPNDIVCEATIDPEILPLVRALVSCPGVTTRASCQGHWGTADLVTEPYVSFNADLGFCQQLHARLAAAMDSDALLHFWEITAAFDVRGQLSYRLVAPTPHLPPNGAWPWRASSWWRQYRTTLRQDIRVLCTLLTDSSQEL